MTSFFLPLLTAAALAFSPADDPTEDSQSADPNLTQVVETDETVAEPGDRVELSAGHVDLGPRLDDDMWEFMARDDTQPDAVWRHLSDVIFRVSDDAILQIPDSPDYAFIDGSGDAYVIPQQEIPGVVWLGWNTQFPDVVNQTQGTVDFIYEGHEGPGHFSVFVQAGNFSGPQVLWNSSDEVSQPASVELNTHTHANWVFTEPGIHTVRMTVQATTAEGTVHSDTQTLTFAVGSDTDASDALEAPADTEDSAETSETTDNAQTADSEPAPQSDDSNSVTWIAAGAIGLALLILAGIFFVLSRRQKTLKEKALDER